MKSAHAAALLAGLSILGCDSIQRGRPALGDANEVVVVMADSLWAETGDSLRSAVAPRIFSVHDERPFEVTHVSPVSELWFDLQRFKQVIAVGIPGDFFMQEALGDRATAPPATLPPLFSADNVWARGQSVLVVTLDSDDPAAELLNLLPEIGAQMDDRFRKFARNRMFLSDTNITLRDSLAAADHFEITLPNIYRQMPGAEKLRVFHNRNEVGGDLFRTIAVSWAEGRITDPDATRVLAWRDSILQSVYDLPQVTSRERIEISDVAGQADGSIQVQGVWQGTDPTFPTGGPFIDRLVVCPDQNRTYLLEAWMYGPGRDKYEYLIQFETILDSFRCGA